MRYKTIPSQLFIDNRKKLVEKLMPNAIAIFNANDIMPKDGDDIIGFKQNSDFFYLSGIDQEESILLLYPDAPIQARKQILFIKKTNENIAIWEGKKYTQEEASSISGIQEVHWLEDFPPLFRQLVLKAEHIYLNTNEHLQGTTLVETRDQRFLRWCKEHYPLHQYRRIAPIMGTLRAIKSSIEIELIQQACTITRDAFLEMLPYVKPGVMEYALEGAFIHGLIKRGSRGFAYAPIIAGGERANILHYTANDQPCKAGDLLLIDAAGEYAGYCADMTRVIPINGIFTPRQKTVYLAVLRILEKAKKLLLPGKTLVSYQKEVCQTVEEELVNLGLLTYAEIKNQNPQNPAYKKYFMHGISHHLGLGVHDFAFVDQPIVPNMVLTIEPGIYIREEKIGIRLENDVVVCENGIKDLMADIPLDPEAIEALLQGR